MPLWFNNMKSFLWKWLPICFGCHQKESRTIHIHNKPLPLCARCTGELIGIIFCILTYWWAHLSVGPCFFLLLPLVADGTIQQWTSYESTNIRRLWTGFLFGYGLCALFFHSSQFMFALGVSMGKGWAMIGGGIPVADFGGKHWWLLGFLLPPIGFLLFAFLRCSRPKTAKDLLHGACFGLLFYAFCYGCFFLSHLKTSTGYRYWQ